MPVTETYPLQLANGPLAKIERWTLDGVPQLLLGGSILGTADAEHLRKDLGVTHVLNLETEHTDPEYAGLVVLNNQTFDDGGRKPTDWFKKGLDFVGGSPSVANAKCYVHCQVGGSRTPMMVYALLRGLYKHSPATALLLIQTVKPSFGSAAYHVNYIASAEQALALLGYEA